MTKIKSVWAREVLDSRAIPTVESVCLLDNNQMSVASVPSGASTGKYESLELRDHDTARYSGKGVLKAVGNINNVLGPAIIGMNPEEQEVIDEKLIHLDGTKNKNKYGANATLAISFAVAKSASLVNGKTTYAHVNQLAQRAGIRANMHIPTPLFNMINGGLHGAGNLDFQEFHVIPATSRPFSEALRSGVEIYHGLGETLVKKGAI